MTQAQIKDWMVTDIITVHLDTTLPDAHKLMKDNNIRRLPVVNDANELIGIVTRGDVRGASPSPATSLNVWELNYLLAKLTVSEFMTRHVATVSPETTIVEAAELMMHKKVSGLPVVNEGNTLVGIITESDIFRLVVHDWRQQQQESSEPYTHYG